MTSFHGLSHFLLLCVMKATPSYQSLLLDKQGTEVQLSFDTSITQKFFLDLVKQNLPSPLAEHTYSLNVTKCRSNFHPSDWLSGAPKIPHSEFFKGLERKSASASSEVRKSRLIIDILISDLREIGRASKTDFFYLNHLNSLSPNSQTQLLVFNSKNNSSTPCQELIHKICQSLYYFLESIKVLSMYYLPTNTMR